MQGEEGYGSKTAQAIATANGLYSAGGAVGSLFIMWAATALGRKVSIQIGAACAVLGGALQGGAANLALVFPFSFSPPNTNRRYKSRFVLTFNQYVPGRKSNLGSRNRYSCHSMSHVPVRIVAPG